MQGCQGPVGTLLTWLNNLQCGECKENKETHKYMQQTSWGPILTPNTRPINFIEQQSLFLLRLDNSMLRGDGQAVSRPGQIEAQLSGRVVPNLNLSSGGFTI